ncbi:hypothetical protein KN1_11190 [Stygiolobus caldivivus]|uniref:Uncharacterized protein n=1 Tax=Stygiolobus caldivivus TaxID=2824673 RepID=A0A8D5U5V0_9CREN|nr:hypothetical protein KN1_11190 [Stygiolobus caldivivus]
MDMTAMEAYFIIFSLFIGEIVTNHLFKRFNIKFKKPIN